MERLNYGKVKLGMYHKDLLGQFNDLADDAMKKPFLKTAVWNYIVTPIHCDLFKQDRYLLSDYELSIEVHRNDNKFLQLSDGTEYKAIVEDLGNYV